MLSQEKSHQNFTERVFLLQKSQQMLLQEKLFQNFTERAFLLQKITKKLPPKLGA
jgi:hypothetical protein